MVRKVVTALGFLLVLAIVLISWSVAAELDTTLRIVSGSPMLDDPPTATATATEIPPWPTDTPTPGPSFPDPIYNEADAIARAQVVFPQGTSPLARLVSHVTLTTAWTPGGTFAPYNPASAVWLVGMQASGLTASDAVKALGIPGAEDSTNPTVVDGVFVAWDANSGLAVAAGTLLEGQLRSYSALMALPNESILIEVATPQP